MHILEKYFQPFRNNIIGNDAEFISPRGIQKILYADWAASGRLYGPIEETIISKFGPFMANTHTETSETGRKMTQAYNIARGIIKKHLNAGTEDILISAGSGMTGVVNKLIRILDLSKNRHCHKKGECKDENERPVIFLTHMEHHSNQTSWIETVADVEIIPPDNQLLVSPDNLQALLEKYKNRKIKIGSFSACSNVTGIITPYHELAALMHHYGGYAFVDFSASAPYVDINMHPENPAQRLDAVFFSPHKFLGGPGTSGIMIFNSALYNNSIPDNPGGGTVSWTNPWKGHQYLEDIEHREDGGTPAILQTIRTALAIRLKEKMGTGAMKKREKEILKMVFPGLSSIPGVTILAESITERMGIVSFYMEDIHFNLVTRLLNDYFGIQMRGGCSCAGTYGHFLLNVSREKSRQITGKIDQGDLSVKPGWIRWSFHPTTTDEEVRYILDALKQISARHEEWGRGYLYDSKVNEFFPKTGSGMEHLEIEKLFNL